MRIKIEYITPTRTYFTAEQHRWVQEEIERRAHKFWLAGGSRQGIALSDWLRAEREVLEQFCVAFEHQSQSHQPHAEPEMTRPFGRVPNKTVLPHGHYCMMLEDSE
ncbi:MAG: DUF2934 domain-containing protein [Verrucomicrobia bacterium]|nr:DUF2934 domain-containing protein [Verrucomicrobiota bacterium]